MSKFKVEIVETYRRYVEIEAEDEDAAYDDIDNQVVEGVIDLPRDGKDYKYDRELFVTNVCKECIYFTHPDCKTICDAVSGKKTMEEIFVSEIKE